MGIKSSKNQVVKNEIPTSSHSVPRTPTSGRGTSTSPSEAWERGSEDYSRDQDFFNSTNSSYNLLDLQVKMQILRIALKTEKRCKVFFVINSNE